MNSHTRFRGGFFGGGLAVLAAVCVCWLIAHTAQGAREDDGSTRTRPGQTAPDFTLTMVDGEEFSLKAHRGKVVQLTFFATWCGPCRAEMPRLEEAWKRHQSGEFAMLVVGREHSNEEVAAFKKEQKLSFSMAGDPDRNVYSQYAEKWIPRVYVIDPNGAIAYQGGGPEGRDLDRMNQTIEAELEKLREP
jgi:peroxiredoxin